ncbi:MAG: hypothetical protein ACREOW_18345 [Thermodesulfobacteriota bacterium]
MVQCSWSLNDNKTSAPRTWGSGSDAWGDRGGYRGTHARRMGQSETLCR